VPADPLEAPFFMTWSRPISVWLAPALLVALGVLAILTDAWGVQSALSNRLFDSFQRHAPRIPVGSPVRVLELPALDEDNLVRVTRALTLSGARLVVFTAPVANAPSPQSLAARLPPGSDAARAALATLPEPGHELAAELRKIKGVVPVMLGAPGREPHIRTRFVYRGAGDPFGQVPRFYGAAAPGALLEDNAAGTAAPNLITDADGVVRRLPLASHLGDGPKAGLVPGLAAEAWRVARGRPDITVISDERNPLSFLKGVGIAALESDSPIPADSDGTIRLHYAADASARLLDAANLEDTAAKDAIVVVGAKGALMVTPFGPASIAGVTAEGIENLLSGDVLSRPGWMPFAEALLLAVLGAAMTLLLRFGLGWTAAFVFAAIAALGLGAWYLYAGQSMLADAATPGLALLLAFAGGAMAYLHDMRRAYAGLRMAFSDSLPRATIEKIARRPELLHIEGESRIVTYLVCGVRHQQGLADAFKGDAAGFTNMMQRVLTPLIDQALAHGGTIDRLTADGFACFWNAPLDDADHALHACEAANGMAIMSSRVTESLAVLHASKDAPPLVEIGVGVATGPVVAGAFGGAGRLGYSVNGDVVVLAQRVQALSYLYGPALIVADQAKRAAERGFAFLEVDTIAGPDNAPVTLHAIMGNPVARASPKFRALTVFHDHIFQAIRKQQWQMARELIAQCRRLSGASQKMYDLHLTRIAYYEKHPPGENWDGAFRTILE
jgi:adenylate cyclase